jgi:hypothetical protein
MRTNSHLIPRPRLRHLAALPVLDDGDLDTLPGFTTTIVSRAVPIVPRAPSSSALSAVLTLVREVDGFARAFDRMASSLDHLEALESLIVALVGRGKTFQSFVHSTQAVDAL